MPQKKNAVKKIQGAAWLPLPRLFSPSLISRRPGVALRIAGSLLCPRAAREAYDQVLPMSPGPFFRKQAVFATRRVPANDDLPAQMKFAIARNPEKISRPGRVLPQHAMEWPIAL
jgi:hypothetical protein